LLRNNHLPICYHHRQSGSRAYNLQARPAPKGPGLRLTAMPRPNLSFNGLHLRNPCKLHGSLLIYRPRRDGRLSWPSWLTHSRRLTHEVVTRQPWIRRRSGKVRQLQTDVLTTEPRCQPNNETDQHNYSLKVREVDTVPRYHRVF